MPTKMMFGSTRIKGIGTQIVSSLKEGKSLGGHDEMDKTLFRADRTITFSCFEFFDCHSIANFAAMTAALITNQSRRAPLDSGFNWD